jgi:hypothetical protein
MATTSNTSREQAGNVASDLKNKAQSAASQVADKGKEFLDKAKDMGANLADKAKDVASTAGHKADDAVSSVGSGMESLAGTMRDKLPGDGYLGSASSAVAGALEKGGHYLKEEGLSGMADDLAGLIRRNPVPAVLIGIGVGFLLARATRS